MYLERLELDGFRNCCERVTFDPSLTLLLGENGVGKSNIIDALRLVLYAEQGADRASPRLSDFAHDGTGKERVDEFTIRATFAGLSIKEQGQMATALAPKTAGPGKARLGVRVVVLADGRTVPIRFGGDLDRTDVEQRAWMVACHTYLPPLRDAGRDLQPGRTNRLARLMQVLTPATEARERLEGVAQQANDKLAEDPSVRSAVGLVQRVVTSMTGSGHHQFTDMAFADSEFDALVRSLLARLGERNARELLESGLGYQNILYMAVLLSHLSKMEALPLRLLLVEEPEAHLHPQLQDLLLRYLQEDAVPGRQVIVTSNSPHFAAAAELERLIVVARPSRHPRASVHRVADVAMKASERAHVRRFLDVTKAGLFFARGVVLVEGVSEQLLLPMFARIAGRDLADAGVTVINVGGVAFRSFSGLFAEGALPIRCAIVSDGDPEDDMLEPGPRARRLAELAGGHLHVGLATVTFEWDVALANERNPVLLDALDRTRERKGPEMRRSAATGSAWADAFRDAIGAEKAVFAQELAAEIELQLRNRKRRETEAAERGQEMPDDPPLLVVPDYLQRAIAWVAPRLRPAALSDDASGGDEQPTFEGP